MLEPVNSMVTWCFLFEPKPNQYKTENVFGPFLSTVCILVIKAGIQIFDYIQIKIKMSNSSQEPPASSKTWMFLATSKSREGTKIWDLGVSKTSDHIQIKIMIPNYSQVHPGSINLQSPKLGHTGHGCSSHHQNQDKQSKKIETWVYQILVTMEGF